MLGDLLDVVIHSCILYVRQKPHRLFIKYDRLVWDDRKFVTTVEVKILVATSLLLIGIVDLPSGLVHDVHCTGFSTHPSKMIAAWRYVNTLRIPLSYDVGYACKVMIT